MNFEIVTDERTPIERKLRIRVESETVSDAWKQELKRLAGEVEVPGFRKGKAPSSVVENRVGREAIWKKVRQDVAHGVMRILLRDAKPEPLAPPKYDFTPSKQETGESEDQIDADDIWEPGQTFKFKATYLLPPPTPEEIEVDLLKGHGIEEPEVSEPGMEVPKPPDVTPPDPRSDIPGSGTHTNN
jgi:FKBP-type peptidyl-prolyl cis-trans isomerase (trigger factor)